MSVGLATRLTINNWMTQRNCHTSKRYAPGKDAVGGDTLQKHTVWKSILRKDIIWKETAKKSIERTGRYIRHLWTSSARKKAKSWEPAYSSALSQNKIGRQVRLGSRSTYKGPTGRHTVDDTRRS